MIAKTAQALLQRRLFHVCDDCRRALLKQIWSQLGRKSLPLKQHLAVFERVLRHICDPILPVIPVE